MARVVPPESPWCKTQCSPKVKSVVIGSVILHISVRYNDCHPSEMPN